MIALNKELLYSEEKEQYIFFLMYLRLAIHGSSLDYNTQRKDMFDRRMNSASWMEHHRIGEYISVTELISVLTFLLIETGAVDIC
ncbi:hypothetical protein, partial [Klebsiella pneumoniae]|uniref:hypothetical protein n=1 Tax=Klebsiella pneumoniae TaxID=573 RepID=UPI0025A310A2